MLSMIDSRGYKREGGIGGDFPKKNNKNEPRMV